VSHITTPDEASGVRVSAFAVDGQRHLFGQVDERWVNLGPGDLVDALRAGEVGADAATSCAPPPDAVPLAVVARPAKLIFVGVNYQDHLDELPPAARVVPTEPVIFSKLPSAIIGPEDPILIPAGRPSSVDYEGELAVVIGTTAKAVAAERALEYVFGYTIVNDVSDRELQFTGGQLTMGKGVDSFCPIGPCVVTADEIPDSGDLAVWTRVNGEVRQESNTANMLFSVSDVIASVTRLITLEPGDVVSTGTPAGVGAFRTPPLFLQAGDTVTVGIERIGELTNPVAAYPG
jgi:2-keto-4-pentenoate hydratase/2-oxohepta-3-ene-1,7-dioic acid hydratase in catechol pathway